VNSILFGEKNIGNVMDYFEHLEIEENPFNTQDLSNQDLCKPLTTDTQYLDKPLVKPLTTDNDNTPVKSWKDFKNRMNS
jgi:hypothetical protein